MNLRLIRFFIVCVFALFSIHLSAQKFEKDEYRAEIGMNGGGSFYIGDANYFLFNNTRVAGSGFFRYRFNPRLALRTELTYATVGFEKTSGIKDNTVFIGDICGEFNFFDLEQNPYKRYSKTFSPYVFTGISMLTDVYNGQLKTLLPELGLAFGVGMKVKLNKHWNLNAQWSNSLLFADNLEGTSAINATNDPLNNSNNLNGSNIFNNDLISTFTIGLSYNIWEKQCDCRKY
jgi:hypothetical protein